MITKTTKIDDDTHEDNNDITPTHTHTSTHIHIYVCVINCRDA